MLETVNHIRAKWETILWVWTLRRSQSADERFERSVKISRLKQLQLMGLAKKTAHDKWTLNEDWEDTLKAMGRRGDIVRSIAHAMGKVQNSDDIEVFHGGSAMQKPVIGKLVADGPGDELRDTRFLVIDGIDGKRWHVDLGRQIEGGLPPEGAIVEVAPRPPAPRPSDLVIAEIAAKNDGAYSTDLHRQQDQRASHAFLDAHKKRLEALRRIGIAQRLDDGNWRIGEDFLERTAAFEGNKSGGAAVSVKSWVSLEAQAERNAPTWLDTVEHEKLSIGAFSDEVRNALKTRAAYLARIGAELDAGGRLTSKARDKLAVKELNAAGAKIAHQAGMNFISFESDPNFSGVYQRPVNLAQGRFALITWSKEFTLVPWRPEIEKARGKQMLLKATSKDVSWTIGKPKTLGR